ncbi:MAG: N5-glutamine methyltransferase family protein, partial [Methyloceanibacter sp.]
RFDLILANPPYIETGKIADLAPEVSGYDPRLALDGGGDGLAAYRRIASRAAEILRPGGSLIVEIGASQAEPVRNVFRASGLHADEDCVRHDLAGRPRVVRAEAASGPGTEGRSLKKGLESPDVQARFGQGNEFTASVA